MPIRVVIVDDHPIVRDGTRRALLDAGLEVVASRPDGASALAALARLQPDVLLLDLHLPDMNGIEIAQRVRTDYPNVAIVVLTGYADIGYERALLELGARGFLHKTATGAEIVAAVERAVTPGEGPTVQVDAPKPLPGKPLTLREQEVLQLVAAGLQNNEIADELVVRLRTVEFHVTNILEKLSARSRSDARDIARRLGWLPHPARVRTRRPADG